MSTHALIQRYYDSFNQGDMATFLSLLDDQVVHQINQGEEQRGKALFESFMGHMNTCYRERLTDMVIMVSDSGERAAAEFVVHGEYLVTDEGLPEANGQTYTLPAGAFFEVRNGLICRVTNYYNLNDWIAQVGA